MFIEITGQMTGRRIGAYYRRAFPSMYITFWIRNRSTKVDTIEEMQNDTQQLASDQQILHPH